MTVKLHVRHRGKRGMRVLNLASGARITLQPGQERVADFGEEYAETLRQRSSRGLDVEVRDLDETPPPPVPPEETEASDTAELERAAAELELALEAAPETPQPRRGKRAAREE